MSHLMIRGNILSPSCNIVMGEHYMFSQKSILMLCENDFLQERLWNPEFGRDNYLVILLLGVLYVYIITIVYQQSREQKRVGGQLAPVSPINVLFWKKL